MKMGERWHEEKKREHDLKDGGVDADSKVDSAAFFFEATNLGPKLGLICTVSANHYRQITDIH